MKYREPENQIIFNMNLMFIIKIIWLTAALLIYCFDINQKMFMVVSGDKTFDDVHCGLS